MKRQNLLIDADDTLWHNNIFFEKGIIDFTRKMVELGFDRELVEPLLRRREMENVRHHGYGSVSYTISMKQVYQEICNEKETPPADDIVGFIESIGLSTREYPIDLLPGVEKTLPLLAEKHVLHLVTKGRHSEQMGKIERSGLGGYFREIMVVEEKRVETYVNIVEKLKVEPETTWMVGNSQKSDINPAKAAGLRTILIPYHATWEFEVEKIKDDGHETIILDDFSGLLKIFNDGEKAV